MEKNPKLLGYCGIYAKELYYGDIAYGFIEGSIIHKGDDGWKDFGKDFAPLIEVSCQKSWDKVF